MGYLDCVIIQATKASRSSFFQEMFESFWVRPSSRRTYGHPLFWFVLNPAPVVGSEHVRSLAIWFEVNSGCDWILFIIARHSCDAPCCGLVSGPAHSVDRRSPSKPVNLETYGPGSGAVGRPPHNGALLDKPAVAPYTHFFGVTRKSGELTLRAYAHMSCGQKRPKRRFA